MMLYNVYVFSFGMMNQILYKWQTPLVVWKYECVLFLFESQFTKTTTNQMAFVDVCNVAMYSTSIVERTIMGYLHEDQLIAPLFQRKT
jgi:hypothetical protein